MQKYLRNIFLKLTIPDTKYFYSNKSSGQTPKRGAKVTFSTNIRRGNYIWNNFASIVLCVIKCSFDYCRHGSWGLRSKKRDNQESPKQILDIETNFDRELSSTSTRSYGIRVV